LILPIFFCITKQRRLPDQGKGTAGKGESGKNWPLIILAILLALLAAAIVAAGAAAFMFRRRILTGLFAATLGPRTTDESAGVVQTTTEEHEVKKEKPTGTKHRGQRLRTRPHEGRQQDGIPMGLVNKREERTFEGLEKLTKFMVSPQHRMVDGYARRPCDNCWDGKSTRDIDKGVLPTFCTGCATRKGPLASEAKQMEVWERAKEMATLLPQELRPKNCARATKKERMYIGYYFKDGLGHNKETVLPGEEPTQEDFVQTCDINYPREKQVVNHGKPY
jgi:hypothetical protein